jgi:hypothetical protein
MPYVGKDIFQWVGCAVPEELKHNLVASKNGR